jgi:hypothetical protein
MYPLGAQAMLSALHWDARVAVIDTSPLRLRRGIRVAAAGPIRRASTMSSSAQA